MKKSKWRTSQNGAMGKFILCVGAGILFILLYSLLAAIIADLTTDPTSLIPPLSLAVTVISAITLGLFLSFYKKDGGAIQTTVISALIAVIMLLLGLVLFGGRINAASLVNWGCYIAISTLAAYLGRSRKGRRGR